MQFIDKEDDLALGTCHFFEHGFEAFLEFAAIFGTCNQRTQVKRNDLLVSQGPRYIPTHNALS